jgi:hypothetical protein
MMKRIEALENDIKVFKSMLPYEEKKLPTVTGSSGGCECKRPEVCPCNNPPVPHCLNCYKPSQDTLREKIAKYLYGRWGAICRWDILPEQVKTSWFIDADKILEVIHE